MIQIGAADILLAAGLVIGSAGLSLWTQMGVQRALLWSALRMAVQLACVGYVLRLVFRHDAPVLTASVLFLMVGAAAWEVGARQTFRRDYGATLLMLLVSAGSVSLIALAGLGTGALRAPQMVVPVFGIVLGAAMNSAALTLHALADRVSASRAAIEARLALGHEMADALRPAERSAIATGTIPILNQMAGAGVITLPGIMSGQVLAGQDPMQAALYQIFLMCLLATVSVLCGVLSVRMFRRRITDGRARLRMDRL